MVEVIEHKFSDNAIQMMKGRYLIEDETPRDMFIRVSTGLAETEKKYLRTNSSEADKLMEVIKFQQEFFNVMISGKFVPAGRTLTNTGISSPVVPNCIVLPIEDSMDSIFTTLRHAALLQQAGSGIGFNFSKLRPADYDTKRSRGKASGPVSFLQTYNDAFAKIQQQGRHGANMAMMHIDHPDILDFILCKEQEGTIANFNISVLITDEFMKKLQDNPDELWLCNWNGHPSVPRHIIRDKVGVIQEIIETDITVRELFNKIVQGAWKNGEPGVAFIDEINRTNPLPGLGDLDCSNPCGEQYLHAYDNCNLGSINLDKFVIHYDVEDKLGIYYEELTKVTTTSVRMLDDVIDTFDIPVKEVQDMAQANRRIGLGIMGFADMLYQLEIPYDSDSALQIAEHIMETIDQAAKITSIDLGKEKGIFPNQDKASESFGENKRNAALTTVAPTGSISMLYDTSSGIEPNFALRYIKSVRTGDYVYLNEHFLKALKKLDLGEQGEENVILHVKQTGSLKGSGVILPKEFEAVFVTANDISIDAHINMQAIFQEYVDNSISKTINMPESTTEEEVRQAFIRGWKMKCKSFTVYRNNSRVKQVLNIGDDDEVMDLLDDEDMSKGYFKAGSVDDVTVEDTGKISDPASLVNKIAAQALDAKKQKVKRPKIVEGYSPKIVTAHGNMYLNINSWDGKVYEVFANVGKPGGCAAAYMGALTRIITLGLRHGVPLAEVVEQLKDTMCHTVWDNGVLISSPPDGMAWALAHHIPEDEQDEYTKRILEKEKRQESIISTEFTAEQMTPKEGENTVDLDPREGKRVISDLCDACYSTNIVYQEGCKRCLACGESKCG